MSLKKILLALVLTLILTAHLFAGESPGTKSLPNFSLYSTDRGLQNGEQPPGESSDNNQDEYKDGERDLMFIFLLVPLVGIPALGTFAFSIPAIISSAMHANNIYSAETLMFTTTSLFSISFATLLTVLVSVSFDAMPSRVISIICGSLAAASLIPAIILTDSYVRLEMRGYDVITGLLWSWSSFGLFSIPAIVGAIIGIFLGVEGAMLERKREQKVSLLLSGDRIGISVKL